MHTHCMFAHTLRPRFSNVGCCRLCWPDRIERIEDTRTRARTTLTGCCLSILCEGESISDTFLITAPPSSSHRRVGLKNHLSCRSFEIKLFIAWPSMGGRHDWRVFHCGWNVLVSAHFGLPAFRVCYCYSRGELAVVRNSCRGLLGVDGHLFED